MAAATIVNTSYGYYAHTGTDETTVTTHKVRLLAIETMGTAGNETVIVTDNTADEHPILKVVAVANKSEINYFEGIKVEGLKVTLSAGTIRANFFIE